jgi:hypothetical protein
MRKPHRLARCTSPSPARSDAGRRAAVHVSGGVWREMRAPVQLPRQTPPNSNAVSVLDVFARRGSLSTSDSRRSGSALKFRLRGTSQPIRAADLAVQGVEDDMKGVASQPIPCLLFFAAATAAVVVASAGIEFVIPKRRITTLPSFPRRRESSMGTSPSRSRPTRWPAVIPA